jgi:hypothetical protein
MSTKLKSVAIVCALVSLQFLAACQSLGITKPPASTLLRTDSTEIGAHMSGFYYLAKIGFEFTNTTRSPISRAGCGGPGFPDLEKKVGEQWVRAYDQISLLCRTIPDFTLPSGGTYRGVLDFMAAAPGHNAMPRLLVDSIEGMYRLRWDFAEGTDDGTRNPRVVKGISNEFRMILR